MTRRLLLGLWSALLPASEREPLRGRLDYDVPTEAASWALAGAQLSLIPVWAIIGLSYAREVVGVQASSILATSRPPTFTEAMLASIALGPLAFLVSPVGLLLEYVILTGVVRLAGLVASDRATGDPLITLLAWLRRVAIAEIQRRRRLRVLGAWRPDRIVQVDEGLVVLSSRDKPDWNERVTIEYRGAFYRLVRREDRPYDGCVDVAHVLRRQQPGELIRRLVTLEEGEVAASDRPTPQSRA